VKCVTNNIPRILGKRKEKWERRQEKEKDKKKY
jgi:hypothetical protein